MISFKEGSVDKSKPLNFQNLIWLTSSVKIKFWTLDTLHNENNHRVVLPATAGD